MGEQQAGAEHADLGEVLRGEAAIGARAAADVVERHHRAAVVGDALRGDQELVAAELGGEGHGPRADVAVEGAVEAVDRVLDAADGLGGVIDREVDGVVAVGDVLAGDDADAGLVVGVEAGVDVLGGAGVDDVGGAALEQLDGGEERRLALLLGGHRGLHLEDVGEAIPDVVGKDAADGVGVADVHVAVGEAGGDDHVGGIDGAIGAEGGEFGGLADVGDDAVLGADGAVGEDAAIPVDGEDEAGVLDLQGACGHAWLLPRCSSIGRLVRASSTLANVARGGRRARVSLRRAAARAAAWIGGV